MLRLTLIPVLFLIACFLAGLYGAIHNQISYTVSTEYFTAFKFKQFNIDPKLPERLGAAFVGWQASWWMGIVIGIFLIPCGLLLRGTAEYFFGMLRVFFTVLLTTMCFSIVGLLIAQATTAPEIGEELSVRGSIIMDPAAFLRAGTMHNWSYIGGLVGIIVGMLSILRRFLHAETGAARIWPRPEDRQAQSR